MKHTFTGTKAWIIGKLAIEHGKLTIKINSEKTIVINTNRENRKMQTLLFVTKDFPYDSHTITLSKTPGDDKAIGFNGIYYLNNDGH